MDPLHPRLQATAIRLLAKYGKPATLVQASAPTGPAWNPAPGVDALTPCVWLETDNSIKNRSSTVIEAGDKFGLVSVAAAVAPALPMQFETDGERYAIVEVGPLNPGGLVMYYEVHVRR